MPVVEGTPAVETRPSASEILLSIGTATLGFLLTAAILHASIRDPLHLHADVRSEKLAMLDQWHGKIFSAAFGTSHIHNGFVPHVFDQLLTGTPAATRTANLAIEGGSQTEQFRMASEFLRDFKPPTEAGAAAQPCLLILELGAGANFTSDHLVHPRTINIYDWNTASLVSHFAGPGMPLSQRVGRVGYAVAGMGLHYSNVGMLSNEIFAPPLSQDTLADQTANDRRGQKALGPNPETAPYIQRMVAGMPQYPTIKPQGTLQGNAELVERLAALRPQSRLSFVYVVMPQVPDLGEGADYPDHLTVRGPHGPLDVPIINLARADRYPQLYAPSLWFDYAHVNAQGADILTKLLADQLTLWYAAHGGPPPCG